MTKSDSFQPIQYLSKLISSFAVYRFFYNFSGCIYMATSLYTKSKACSPSFVHLFKCTYYNFLLELEMSKYPFNILALN